MTSDVYDSDDALNRSPGLNPPLSTMDLIMVVVRFRSSHEQEIVGGLTDPGLPSVMPS
jgi:hypothetical protein